MLVLITLLVVVYVDVVEKVLTEDDAVVVTVFFVVTVVVMVFVAGVTVVSGVEADIMIITSGGSVLVEEVVGTGVFPDVVARQVVHCSVCDVDELTVTVRVSPTINLAYAKKRNSCTSIVKKLRPISDLFLGTAYIT